MALAPVMLTAKQFSQLATKDDLKNFATKDDLKKIEEKLSALDEKLDLRFNQLDYKLETTFNELLAHQKDHEVRLYRLETRTTW